jgi:hypothetical protein
VRVAARIPEVVPEAHRVEETPASAPRVRVAIEEPEIEPQAPIAAETQVSVPRVRVAAEIPAAVPQAPIADETAMSVPQARIVIDAPEATPTPESQSPVVEETPAAISSVEIVTETPVAALQPRIASVAAVPVSADVPQTRPVAMAGAPPKVREASNGKPVASVPVPVPVPAMKAAAVQPEKSASADIPAKDGFKVKADATSHPLKWLCIGMGLLIAFLVGTNYLLVDWPLASGVKATEFAGTTVYGHLGAFVQPDVIVIHVPTTKALTDGNFTRFLVTLAHSTPPNPITNVSFGRVALTSGWTAQYSFSGYSWKQFAGMGGESEAARKEFLLDQLATPGGEPLVARTVISEDAQAARREKIWQQFVDTFAAKP